MTQMRCLYHQSAASLASSSRPSPGAGMRRPLMRPPHAASAHALNAAQLTSSKLAQLVKSQRERLEVLISDVPACSKHLEAVMAELSSLDSILSTWASVDVPSASPQPPAPGSSSSDEDAELVTTARRMMGLEAASAPCGNTHAARTERMLVHGAEGSMFVSVPSLDDAPTHGASSSSSSPLAVAPCSSGRVQVCTGSKCAGRGAAQLQRHAEALAAGAPNVSVVACKCLDKCGKGAAVRLKAAGQAGVTYTRMDADGLAQAMGEHFGDPQALSA